VAVWVERVRLARRSPYFRRALARRLGRLALAVLAQTGRHDPDALKARLLRGELEGDGEVPPEVAAYLAWGLLGVGRPPEPPARRADPLRMPRTLIRHLERRLHLDLDTDTDTDTGARGRGAVRG